MYKIILLILVILLIICLYQKKREFFTKKENFCFIVLRHVNNHLSNKYWNYCVDFIRKLYPDVLIVIIDDHSTIKPYRLNNKNMDNLKVINSELKSKRAEFLPYYYFYKKRFADKALIIHDTVFIHEKIDKKYINTNTFHSFWTFSHKWNSKYEKHIIKILKQMDNSNDLINLYYKEDKWSGFFGGMSIIDLDFISNIFNNNNYIHILKENINSRETRMAFERIIGLILVYHNKKNNISINKNIHNHLNWGISFDNYLKKKNKKNMEKIWVGQHGKR